MNQSPGDLGQLGVAPGSAELRPARRLMVSMSWSRRIAAAAALGAATLGAVATLGWITGAAELIQILPALPPMTRNTAACFILLGAAVLVLAFRGPRLAAVIPAALVAIIAVLTDIEIVFKVDTGINEILGSSYINTLLVRRGGMAPGTAICFSLASLVLLLAPWLSPPRSSLLLGLVGSGVAAFGVSAIVGLVGGVALAALHTAVGFCLLGLALMASAWQHQSSTAPTPRWLPLTVAIFVVSGILGLWRAVIIDGHQPFSLLPVIVLIAGGTVAVSFALSVYLAQREHARAAALRRNETELRQIVDNIPSLVSLLAPDGSVELINRRTLDFTGKTRRELEQWGSSDLVHPDDLPHAAAQSMAGTASGKPYEIVYRMRRHDGDYRWFEAIHIPLVENGRVYRWCVSITDIDDRKRMEDVLRESEGRARLIVDGIPGGIEVLSASGEIEFVNDHIVTYFGQSAETIQRHGLLPYVHPDDLETVRLATERSIATGEAYYAEHRFRRADGAYRWFRVKGLPLRDNEGRIVRWYALHAEIEEQRQIEEALRESERRARLIVDSIPGLIAVFSADGELQLVNEQTVAYFGRSLEDQKDWEVSGTMNHPEDRARVAAIFQASIKSGEPFSMEVRGRRADGAYRWMESRGQPLRDESGTIVNWYNLLVDVDDRKRAEEALAASERHLQLTIDTMPALAWSTTPDGKADFFNQHYLDFVGLTREQLLGDGWVGSLHPDDIAPLATTWGAILASGQAGEAEARLRRHDGVYRWFLQRANPLHDDQGTIVRWYGINTDIEDRKRAEASLAREKQLLEMVASGRNLREVLTELCRFVEDDAVDVLCDVHPIDWNTKTFRYGTSPSLPADYTAPISGLAVEDELLPCAVAAHEKVQIIAEDLETDPRWQSSHVRTHALKYGLRAVWSTPIIATSGTVLGTLCIYQRRPGTPSEQHQSLIAHATHIASIAIERLQTEEELRRSYERLAAAQKLSKTGNFTADVIVDNHIWSAELYRIFELELGTKISVQHVRDVIHPDDLANFDAGFQRSAAEGERFDQVFRIVTSGGNLKYVHALAEVAELEAGRPVFSGAIRDVTIERVSEEALNKTRSELAHVTRVTALSTLSASIAHEVSQPLSGIITNAGTSLRMLAADPPDIEGALETARRTIRDGNRASEVITRLRALFSNRTTVSDRVDINEAARDVIALSLGEMQRNRIEVAFNPAAELPLVAGDRVQLQQVILNLLLNASDALHGVGDRTRVITITTAAEADEGVRLTVSDTGTGIDPEVANKLFDAFFTTKVTGMGIGLSVSRSIIEHHHGRIWASANTDGPGASVSFALPGNGELAADAAAQDRGA